MSLKDAGRQFGAPVIGLILAVGVAAFFAGAYFAGAGPGISQQDLDDAVDRLELKILQSQLPAERQPVRISADDDPVIGNPDAPITIIEFSDFECPFCARFHLQTLPLLMEEYIEPGTVRLVFRDFPIQSIHPNAVPASVAANCAHDQGKFKEMHDSLFENQARWSDRDSAGALELFSGYAAEIGLEQEEFDLCLSDGRHVGEIQGDLQDGRSYQVTGTPGFFVGNDAIGYVQINGAQPFESFQRVIDAQLGA